MFKVTEIPIIDILIEDRSRLELTNIQSLQDSIERNGLLQPIIINDQNKLLAGGRRITACKNLKWETIPCRIIPGLTKDAELMIELIENVEREDFTWAEELELKYKLHNYWKSLETGWGYRETAAKLKVSIGGLSTDLTLAAALPHFPELKTEATKAKAREAYKKMQQQAEAITAIANLPESEKANLKKMMNGESTILTVKNGNVGGNGDGDGHQNENVGGTTGEPGASNHAPISQSSEDNLPQFNYEICSWDNLIVKIPKGSIGFAELDPPYAIDFNNVYGQTSDIKSKEDDFTVAMLNDNMTRLLPQLYKRMLDNSWVLCWTGKEHWINMNNFAQEAGFNVQPPGIWVKPSGSSNTPSTNMISTYEMFLLFRKGKATFNVSSFNSIQECTPPSASIRTHQWEKPIKLYNTFFSALGKQNTIFFSPFAGSGASMVAATLNKMIPFGCDIQQKYFFSFIKMMKNYHLKEEV